MPSAAASAPARALLIAITLVALPAFACADGDSPTPAPTATPAAPATPTEAASAPTASAAGGPLDHDLANAMAHVRALALGIGPRVSGSPASGAAVAYVAAAFREYGYAVEVMEFGYATRFRAATVTVGGETIEGVALNGPASPGQTAEGRASGGDVANEAPGGVWVRERTTAYPREADLFTAASRAGAAALIVANHPAWPFFGFPVEARDGIPVVLVPHARAERFARAAASGETITITVGPAQPMAANVIARPAGDAACDILAGGHHDTVAGSPGALDNASGVAIVLELARLFAADGPDEGLCFATFGAEESGLFGSRALVERWRASGELPSVMLNFDVTARGDAVELIGSAALVRDAAALLTEAGFPRLPVRAAGGLRQRSHELRRGGRGRPLLLRRGRVPDPHAGRRVRARGAARAGSHRRCGGADAGAPAGGNLAWRRCSPGPSPRPACPRSSRCSPRAAAATARPNRRRRARR